MDASRIRCLLGPTNTGKTHRAVEEMLSHESGMMGLPLRLLAREVYDKITARIGEERVALVTGEEKRIGKRAAYWICTVEAMPLDREVDFVAVDEIQLSGHEQRGHVFTDRLLNARGRVSTWFLGAETMRQCITELVPTAEIGSSPRLSKLTFAGAAKLSKLPQRSAIVAFSAPEVYAIAERLRGLSGGAAVVLGALSPRTRNAQVAMFQAGEVAHLVATDAIGMGLNLDVAHVAFSETRKFDGRLVRDLEATELGQIAGRAGRYRTDGTFGTVTPIELPLGLAQAIEDHRFTPVRRLRYRNSNLDFTSIQSLTESLGDKPRSRRLVLASDAEDAQSLERLAQDPTVRARVRGDAMVRLLWEVASIPDYRKILFEAHVALLAEIFSELTGPHGRLSDDWLEQKVRNIDDLAGDEDTLVARIAAIRTFSFISQKRKWVGDADAWQARTRAVEDRLSDALHERLVARFVQRSARRSLTKAEAASPFATLARLRDRLAPPEPTIEERVDALVEARSEELDLDARGKLIARDAASVTGDDVIVGELSRGASLLLPDVRLVGLLDAGAGARARIHRRLVAFARDVTSSLLAPLRIKRDDGSPLGPSARGLLYQVEQGLGAALANDAREQLETLEPIDRQALLGAGVVLGHAVVYLPRMLRPPALTRRIVLARTFFDAVPSPPDDAISIPLAAPTEARACLAVGYAPVLRRALRIDVLERVANAVLSPKPTPPKSIAGWLGCSMLDLPRVLGAIAELSGASASVAQARIDAR
jgi:ATP-dependent RNA helicase SUPV3L1/SUV3